MSNSRNGLIAAGKTVNIKVMPGETITVYKLIVRGRKTLNLTPGARLTHILLMVLAETEGWDITVSGLATEVGVSRPTMIKYLKQLEAAQLLERKRAHPADPRLDGYLWIVWPLPKPMLIKRMEELRRETEL